MSQSKSTQGKGLISRLKSLVNTEQKQEQSLIEQSHQATVRFESMEPRVLLAGDLPTMVVNDQLSLAGETRQYEFHVDQKQQVLLDTLTTNSQLNWRLSNHQGLDTGNKAFAGNELNNTLTPLSLEAGDYTLTISGNNEAVGQYSFRFINLAEAEPIAVDQLISGEINNAGALNAYTFTAQAGDVINLAWQIFDGHSAQWSMFDSKGQKITDTRYNYNTYLPIVLSKTDSYTLVIESQAQSSPSQEYTSYSFLLNKQVQSIEPLVFDTVTVAQLNPVLSHKTYSFHVDQSSQYYFDALSNSYKFNWSLRGPRGELVSSRSFTQSDSVDLLNASPLLSLVEGDYQLDISSTESWESTAEFRLLSLTQAQTIDANQTITGTLNPANSTHVFHLLAQANEQFYFDKTVLSQEQVYWHLFDPYGHEVTGFTLSQMRDDVGVITLPYTGEYTLLIEGRISLYGQVDYSFKAQRVIDDHQDIVLDQHVQGAIDHVGQQDYYHFSIEQDKAIYIEGLNNLAQGSWRVLDSQGQIVSLNSQSTSSSGTRTLGSQGMNLVFSGDSDDNSYQQSAPFPISFLGNSYNSVYVGTNGYLTFGGGSSQYSGFSANSPALAGIHIAPGDRRLTRIYSQATEDSFRLRVEGYNYGDSLSSTPLIYEVTFFKNSHTIIVDLIKVTNTLYSAGITTGTSSSYVAAWSAQANSTYVIEGNTVKKLALGEGGVTSTANEPWLNLSAGQYTLVVDANTDSLIPNYQFSLRDTQQAMLLTPDTLQTIDWNTTSSQSVLYRIPALAAQQYQLDMQALVNEGGQWQLYDPQGKKIGDSNKAELLPNQTFITQTDQFYTLVVLRATATANTNFSLHSLGSVSLATFPTGTALALNTPIDASLTANSAVDYYFHLSQASSIYIDSLLSSSTAKWQLKNIYGQVQPLTRFSQSNSDDFGSGSPLYPLAAGDYVLSIESSQNETVQFAVLDATQSTVLTQDQDIQNSLQPASQTHLYQFSAVAGQSYYVDSLMNVANSLGCWRLIDPKGRVVIDRRTLAQDLGVWQAAYTGQYQLLIEGRGTNSQTDYRFVLRNVTPVEQTISLDQAVERVNQHIGQQDIYHFHIDQLTTVYLDILQNANATAYLVGPQGQVFSTQSLNSLENSDYLPWYLLPAGDYQLVIENQSEANQYAFVLSNVSVQQQPIILNQTIQSSVVPSSSTRFYQFNAQAGECYIFDVHQANTALKWRLLDPFGRVVDSFTKQTLTQDMVVNTAYTGIYTLLIEGTGQSATSDYQFIVQPLVDQQYTLTLGELQQGNLAFSGQQAIYHVEVSAASLLYLDGLKNRSDLNWSLVNASGEVIANRVFNQSDAQNGIGNYLLPVAAGQYRLIISGNSGEYAFRLSDVVHQATPLNLGQTINANLEPNSSHLYQLSLAAQTEYFLDIDNLSFYSARWSLVDSTGRRIFDSTNVQDKSLFNQAGSGDYYLILEEQNYYQSPIDYQLEVHATAVLPSVDLALNTLVNAHIPSAGSAISYQFSLAQAQQIWLDGMTSKSITWAIYDQYNQKVAEQSITPYLNLNQVVSLAQGNYRLVMKGSGDTTGDFDFSLLAIESAAQDFQQTIQAQQSGLSTTVYRWQAMAGDIYQFQLSVLNSANVYWQIINERGEQVIAYTNNFQGNLNLKQTGYYYLLVSGSQNAETAIIDYQVSTQKVDHVAVVQPTNVQELRLGDWVSSNLEPQQGAAYYHFNLAQATQLYIDGLENAYARWSLYGPKGVIREEFSFSAIRQSLTGLVDAGDYYLSVSGAAGEYGFRVLDIAQAQPLVMGLVTKATLSTSREANIYRFDGVAGQTYYFDAQVNYHDYYANLHWRLIGPDGKIVQQNNFNDLGRITLSQTGQYLLCIDGYIDNQRRGASSYQFIINPLNHQTPINLSADAPSEIADLVVENLQVINPEGLDLINGQVITLAWDVHNIGQKIIDHDWQDRIIIRHANTGNVLAVYYTQDTLTESLLADGLRHREFNFQLPAGEWTTGDLIVEVKADYQQQVNEGHTGLTTTEEENNNASMWLYTASKEHVDLYISDLRLEPLNAFVAGQSVTVHWRTNNGGSASASHTWQDRLIVRNLTTGKVVNNILLPYDTTISGELLSGEGVERAYSFIWPDGLLGIGRFEITVISDAEQQIMEGESYYAEHNNTAVDYTEVGPDLVINQLQVDGNQTPKAGEVVNVSWQLYNQGTSAVGINFSDLIEVYNRSTGELLLRSALAYSVTETGYIASGESRLRQFSFRLADGIRSVGELEIIVTTDKTLNGYSEVYESNDYGNAEYNNSQSLYQDVVANQYADLLPQLTNAPSGVLSGQIVALTWQVTNQGQADAVGAWNDQIILSADNQLGNSDDVVLATVRREQDLAVGASYQQQANVVIPLLATGNYRLFVKTDSQQEVIEPDTRADNISAAHQLAITLPYTDLQVSDVTVPSQAMSGENILVAWQVKNVGLATTDVSQWSDRVILSRDTTLSADDIILSGSVNHTGILAPQQSYQAQASISLPRDLSGEYYIIVQTNAGLWVNEQGHSDNNQISSIQRLTVSLSPLADLTAAILSAPTVLRPNQAATLTYTITNQGDASTNTAWRDRVYIENNQGQRVEVASVLRTQALAAQSSHAFSINALVPSYLAEGEYQWLVVTDSDNSIYERQQENNNTVSAPLSIRKVDLQVSAIQAPSLLVSGQTLDIQWTVNNLGAAIQGTWVDSVYLSQNGQLNKLAELTYTGSLATGENYQQQFSYQTPLSLQGEYEIVIVTDSKNALDDSSRLNNQNSKALQVDLAAYADLVVTDVQTPSQLIADPALLNVSWTVKNQGTGIGQQTTWTDKIVLSNDSILGNGDDRLLTEVIHNGALTVDGAYQQHASVYLPPALSGRFKLFVVSDAKGQVFENQLEANNVVVRDLDVMTQPYADLQVESVSTIGQAYSGKALTVSWTVANLGIGITSTTSWQDNVYLSTDIDGKQGIIPLAKSVHLGALGVDDRYNQQVTVEIPEGLEGTYYLQVQTGGVYEFMYDTNNRRGMALPITLSPSADLIVDSITLPSTAQEGGLIDVTWTVLNQGDAATEGQWQDSVYLVPLEGATPVLLGSYTYNQSLASGIRYTRTEQLRLPSKIVGLYRLQVVTNAMPNVTNRVYEHGAAANNNTRLSDENMTVTLNDRPDLRLTAITVPDEAVAGGSVAVRYTVSNLGAGAATGRWQDKVYLSLDATLSADDVLVGSFDNNSALAPTESYSNNSAQIDIPIRYRGSAYLIVVADANNKIDEYPNEQNNIRAAQLNITPVPFADLVTSNVIAPDQAVYGASIEVRYTVSNKGSATTRGVQDSIEQWTDTVWLAKDPRRPGANKGDILLSSSKHTGKLAVNEDYQGSLQVVIPETMLSGQYFITVWSDTYDVILEDTLASNLNPDDVNGVDNNNYKARAISILGITPPDLVVSKIIAPAQAQTDDVYSFSYTVTNQGDAFDGEWRDKVYLADSADWASVTQVWEIAELSQKRSLALGESYTVEQSLKLPTAIQGRYLLVRTDVFNDIAEGNNLNNARAMASQVTTIAADLQVTAITTEPSAFSGEETTVTWTVTNKGGAVWAGTEGWVDSIFITEQPPAKAGGLAITTKVGIRVKDPFSSPF